MIRLWHQALPVRRHSDLVAVCVSLHSESAFGSDGQDLRKALFPRPKSFFMQRPAAGNSRRKPEANLREHRLTRPRKNFARTTLVCVPEVIGLRVTLCSPLKTIGSRPRGECTRPVRGHRLVLVARSHRRSGGWRAAPARCCARGRAAGGEDAINAAHVASVVVSDGTAVSPAGWGRL
jgi:hypothetical protein